MGFVLLLSLSAPWMYFIHLGKTHAFAGLGVMAAVWLYSEGIPATRKVAGLALPGPSMPPARIGTRSMPSFRNPPERSGARWSASFRSDFLVAYEDDNFLLLVRRTAVPGRPADH